LFEIQFDSDSNQASSAFSLVDTYSINIWSSSDEWKLHKYR